MRLIKMIVFFINLFVFAGCVNSSIPIHSPDDLIPKDTFVTILKEMTLLESYYQNRYGNLIFYNQVLRKSGNKILRKHHIKPDRFERSMNFYSSDLVLIQSVYAEILDSLNREIPSVGN